MSNINLAFSEPGPGNPSSDEDSDTPGPGRSVAAERTVVTSTPEAGPNLDRFWKRVAEVTSRYHDVGKRRIGGEEIREWNRNPTNGKICGKCDSSRVKRICIIDEDQPSCRPCRLMKVGCDRKPRFVFDMTKDQFFPVYEEFLKVFNNRVPGRLRRHKQAENSWRSRVQSKNPPTTRRRGEREESSIEMETRLTSVQSTLNIRTSELSQLREQLDSENHAAFFLGVLTAEWTHIAVTARGLEGQVKTLHTDSRCPAATDRALDTAVRLADDLQRVQDVMRQFQECRSSRRQ
ncbi:hypothetical protein C8R44DRAFT_782076 [Mycena epipterygia]|nr:hypothetical protein C8R44DRAFT_782076 [Mycena epipterygia]